MALDYAYYRRRADETLALAKAAATPESRAVHDELERLYRARSVSTEVNKS